MNRYTLRFIRKLKEIEQCAGGRMAGTEERDVYRHTPKASCEKNAVAFLNEFRRLDNGKGNDGAAPGAV